MDLKTNLPIEYFKPKKYEELKMFLFTVNTVKDNPYFKQDDIAFAVNLQGISNKVQYLKNNQFLLVDAPDDPIHVNHTMKLTIKNDVYVLSPVSSYLNVDPIILTKDEVDNSLITGLIFLTIHDYDNTFELVGL